jgi:hypothetical protein
MTAARRSWGRLCLGSALCLVACIGLSTPQTKAESCAEAIADGGFETGDAWQLLATSTPPEYVTDPVHSGGRALGLGVTQSAQGAGYSSASQVVMIPAEAAEARLSFWFYAEVGDQPGADRMQLSLLNPDDTILAVLWTSSRSSPNWSQVTYDLTPWRGRTVEVYFNVLNDGTGGTTTMVLDDVSLAVCPDGALAALPDDLTATSGTVLETPVMIFFTPTLDGTASQDSQPDSATPDIPPASEAGMPAPQVTRVSLPVTPAATSMPRPTRVTVAPSVAPGTPAPGEGRFAQWPEGWFFGVGMVFAIILLVLLFAWRRG